MIQIGYNSHVLYINHLGLVLISHLYHTKILTSLRGKGSPMRCSLKWCSKIHHSTWTIISPIIVMRIIKIFNKLSNFTTLASLCSLFFVLCILFILNILPIMFYYVAYFIIIITLYITLWFEFSFIFPIISRIPAL